MHIKISKNKNVVTRKSSFNSKKSSQNASEHIHWKNRWSVVSVSSHCCFNSTVLFQFQIIFGTIHWMDTLYLKFKMDFFCLGSYGNFRYLVCNMFVTLLLIEFLLDSTDFEMLFNIFQIVLFSILTSLKSQRPT